MRSLFSERYNASKIRFNEALEEIFQFTPWAPKFMKIPKTPDWAFDNAHQTLGYRNAGFIKRKEIFRKPEISNNFGYDSDEISIMTRWELEAVLELPLLKRFIPNDGDGTFSHTIWENSESSVDDEEEDEKLNLNENVTICLENTMDDVPPKKRRRRTVIKGQKFECTDCGKSFDRSWRLNKHMRQHTGEKPFICPLDSCRRAFADRSNLRAHQRNKRHHDWEYNCFQCGKPFSKLKHMNRHTLDACRKYLLTHLNSGTRRN